MRTTARLCTLAATLLVSTGLSGCRHLEREIEAHFAWMRLPPVAAERSAQAHRARSGYRIVKPEMVPAGARVRQYCGQRHIQFQKGSLQESDTEKMRNNELCRQVYKA